MLHDKEKENAEREAQEEVNFDVHYHLAGNLKAVISPRTAASKEEMSKILLEEAASSPLMIVGTYENQKTDTVIIGVNSIERIEVLRPR